MATDTHKLSEEKRDDEAAASAATESEGGCAESMAEHFTGPGGMKAMANAMGQVLRRVRERRRTFPSRRGEPRGGGRHRGGGLVREGGLK